MYRKAMNVFLIIALLLSFNGSAIAKQPPKNDVPINLSHLDSLNEEVTIDGTEMLITHIYSEYPDYEWVDASGEGIACVDDVARAAIVYLTDFEQTKNDASLEKAKKLLNFVMHMQADDGEFYNFINEDHSINKDGPTSVKSFDWWAARAMWALGHGYKVFEKEDPAYAAELEESFLLGNEALQNQINDEYGNYETVHGVKVPKWITGFDAMSNALLGLAEYYSAKEDVLVKDSMLKLGKGLSKYQAGDFDDYPYSAHLGWNGSPTLWHAWGSSQAFALAKAGNVLDKEEWIQSAKDEADHLFTHILAAGMIKEMAPTPTRDEQIAYGVNMLVQGFMEIYQATNDQTYAQYAGLAGSWFTGNNDADFAMYDPGTGRGYDGLNGDTGEVNLNSGAESTIEALLALQTIKESNQASKYLYAKTIDRHTKTIHEAEDFKTAAGEPEVIEPEEAWTGDALYSGNLVKLEDGEAIEKEVEVKNGEYLIYAALEKQHLPEKDVYLEAKVDGKVVGEVLVSDSPDETYLTLSKIVQTTKLKEGKHRITLTAKGEEPIIVDNIVVQPVKETAMFSIKKNKTIQLLRDFEKETLNLSKQK
ncbi:hypothetical protein [Bacillus sp. Marseille-Q3570]|uniref:hypothetical protein n=1 Tax=Bacillus sp. Marseille-Q3570 TaxID=2963522 RepID=UPI0021B727DF|nr:hypothetical protein [Bacillus sp. Marseille-Q3570]